MCPDGLALCVFETGLAIIGLLVIAMVLGLFDVFRKDK